MIFLFIIKEQQALSRPAPDEDVDTDDDLLKEDVLVRTDPDTGLGSNPLNLIDGDKDRDRSDLVRGWKRVSDAGDIRRIVKLLGGSQSAVEQSLREDKVLRLKTAVPSQEGN